MTKKGFTLVELSIVLVIIGLIIGGILAGQTLIQTARMNAVVKEISSIEINARNFKQTFRYFPGDVPNSASYGLTQTTGNGDGILNPWTFFQNMDETMGTHYELECFSYGIYCPGYTDYQFLVGANMAASKAIPTLGYSTAQYGAGDYNSAIMAGGNQLAAGHSVPRGVLPAIDYLALDKKMDDGFNATGRMRSLYGYPQYNPTSGVQGSMAECYNAAWSNLDPAASPSVCLVGFTWGLDD